MITAVRVFHMEVEVPEAAKGLVIGTGGRTIKRFQQSAGISLARFLPSGKFQIRGVSKEAVQSIVASIKDLIGFAGVRKSAGYSPLFYRNCFCKSTENPLLAVDKVCFEEFIGYISCISRQGKQHLCFKKGEAVVSGSPTVSCVDENLAAALSNKMSIGVFTKVLPHWDFSAYRSELLSCFECREDAMRNIKMIVRFGKQLYHGPHCEDLLHRGFISFSHLQQLCSQKLISSAFSTACSEKAVADLRLHLERLDYVRVSYRRKISIHLTDREEKPIRLSNVSVRCLGEDGFVHNREVQRILRSRDYFQALDVDVEASAIDVQKAYRRCLLKIEFDAGDLTSAEKAKKLARTASDCLMDSVQREKYLSKFYSASPSDPSIAPSLSPVRAEISRVRREPRRHGIVSFCREGENTSDFRLAVMSHEREMKIQTEMVKWVEDAWANRTPDRVFVFDRSSRYQITNIRYKDAETYVTEDFKFRIANVREVDGEAENKRWECALTSRWSKWNDGIAGDVNSTVRNDVLTLIKEAVKFSKVMSPNYP